jgi:hypothetical protein
VEQRAFPHGASAQALVEVHAVATAEDLLHEQEGGSRCAGGGRAVDEIEVARVACALEVHAALAELRRLDRARRWCRRRRRIVPEQLGHPPAHVFGDDVADDDEHGVRRLVVLAVEAHEIAPLDVLDVARPADRVVAIGMA